MTHPEDNLTLKRSNHTWSGRFGFLMAAVGSAVGLGNIWRFPYLAGQQGGAIFLIAYVIMVVVIGFSLMIAEFTIGRHASRNVIDAYSVAGKKWGFTGVISCIASFVIVSYYSVIGGWIIRYAVGYMDGGSFVAGGDYNQVFSSFISNPWMPVVFLIVFMAICLIIILLGVKNGIERVNKILMPLLFVMLVFVMIVALTMKGAVEGVKFFIIPDFGRIDASGGIIGIFLAALGQAFYSLSIGLGIGTTYGSYASKEISLTKNTLLICVSDTVVAMIAGFAILPAVFAAGEEPTAGAGLVFVVLPAVFNAMPAVLGSIVGVVFFLLVLFAAVTSAIALIEVNVAVVVEKFKLNRKLAAVIVVGAATLVGVLVSLSQGGLFGKADLLTIFDTFSNTFLLPLVGILTCIYVGYIWKPANAVKELAAHDPASARPSFVAVWSANIRYVCPVLIAVLFVYGIVDLFI